jgi:hypothetical protein
MIERKTTSERSSKPAVLRQPSRKYVFVHMPRFNLLAAHRTLPIQ